MIFEEGRFFNHPRRRRKKSAACAQERQNTAAVRNVAAIRNPAISLAFWSAVVLHRFSMQQINLAHLSPFMGVVRSRLTPGLIFA